MEGWSQDQIANWQDPMLEGMQQGPKQTGLGGLLPFPGLPGFPPNFMPMPGPTPIKEGPNYEDQFNSFSETLGGFGKQMGGFGEQMGGFDKQFGGIIDRLSKIEEGIAGLMPQGAGAGGGTVPYGNSPTTPTIPSSPLDGGVFSVYSGQNARGY